MKIFFVIIVSFINLFAANTNIAILDFSVNSNSNKNDYLSKGISEIIASNLAEKDGISVLEREKINKIMSEQAFAVSGIVKKEEAIKIGKMLGAEYVIMGSITFIRNTFNLISNVVEIKSGKIIASEKIREKGNEMIFDAVDMISLKIYTDISSDEIPAGNAPKLEIAFILDTTGSMGDELDVVKSKIKTIVTDISNGNPKPLVKIAIMGYKDRGDTYITKKFNFTSDINKMKRYLNTMTASGGGDNPEAVLEGIHDALYNLNWSKSSVVGKICFLVGDAPDHREYRRAYSFDSVIKKARKNSISINTISCSGNRKMGIDFFNKVASETNGNFSFLTYREIYKDKKGKEFSVYSEGDHSVVVDTEDEKAEERSSGKSFFEKRAITKSKPAVKGSEKKRSLRESVGDKKYKPKKIAALKRNSRSVKKENNLDMIMKEQIKSVARKHGISYEKKKGIVKNSKKTKIKDANNTKLNIYGNISANKLKSLEHGSIWIRCQFIKEKGKVGIKSSSIQIINDKKTIRKFKKYSTTFRKVKNRIDYYVNNGMGRNKLWVVEISKDKTKKAKITPKIKSSKLKPKIKNLERK